LTNTPHSQSRPDWSPDGNFVLFQQTSSEANFDLWYVAMHDGRKLAPFRETKYQEFGGRFSPNSKWVAYTSDETRRQEIWVESFPASAVRQQVSIDGGLDPVWSRDGQELFYRSPGGNLMAVPVRHDATVVRFGTPTVLFPIGPQAYDVSLDRKEILTLANLRASDVSPLTLFLNWRQKLERRP